MASSSLTAAQLSALSTAFGLLGDGARSVISNDNLHLTPNQSNAVSSDMTNLYNTAANIATWAAQIVFNDSDAAFRAISDATDRGNDALTALQNDATKVNALINILAAGVGLGVAIGSGNIITIAQAATNLKTAVTSA